MRSLYISFYYIHIQTPKKDPQLPEKWTEPLEARYEGPSAPGVDIFGGNTIDPFASEDCLRLNVFTRQVAMPSKYYQ